MNYNIPTKTTDNFSFTKTVANLANNKMFADGFLDYRHNTISEKSYIWYALSAIGEDIADVLYSNILNYINNIGNVNVCKVKALQSMAQMLGYDNYNFLSDIDRVPIDVLELIDIFSINRGYLTDPTIFSITSQALYHIHKLTVNVDETPNYNAINSAELSAFNLKFATVLDSDAFDQYVENVFYDVLHSHVYAKYNSDTDNYIYSYPNSKLINVLNKSDVISDPTDTRISSINSIYENEIDNLKLNLGIENFDAFNILDNIEFGNDKIENYNIAEQNILVKLSKLRINKNWGNVNEKYAFYKEREVFNYFDFIQNLINGFTNLEYLKNYNSYILDQKYIILSNDFIINNQNVRYLLNDSLEIDENKLHFAARVLTKICFILSDLREKIKTFSQRTNMRGTFLLIAYIINEYLKQTLPLQYEFELANLQADTTIDEEEIKIINAIKNAAINIGTNGLVGNNYDIIEYTDYTEYYNLSTNTSKYGTDPRNVNPVFWEDETPIAGIGLAQNDIKRFYEETLDLRKYDLSNVFDFLNIVYETGATSSYYRASDVLSTSTIVPSIDATDEALRRVDVGDMSEDEYATIQENQNENFVKYTGLSFGKNPVYNWKNTTHSSYQIHPYLYNFIEKTEQIDFIKNSYINSENVKLMTTLMSYEISVHLGEYGNIRNIWLNDVKDYSGYRTRYEDEQQSNILNYGKISKMRNYDGVFFPEAVDEYILSIANTNKLAEMLISVKYRLSAKDIVSIIATANKSSYGYTYPFNKYIRNNLNNYHIDIKNYPEKIHEINNIISLDYLKNDALADRFDAQKAWYNNAMSLMERYENEVLSGVSEEILSVHRNELFDFVETEPPLTFYDKWYSHLGLTFSNSSKIAAQLEYYKNKINELYQSIDVNEIQNDIFKYGVDKYGSSILLYKKYKLNADDTVKRNTRGELWIRFNDHPIGFPAFNQLSSISQVVFDEMNPILYDLISANKTNYFTDFDINERRNYMLLAYNSDMSVDENNIYNYSNILALKFNEIKQNNKIEIQNYYNLVTDQTTTLRLSDKIEKYVFEYVNKYNFQYNRYLPNTDLVLHGFMQYTVANSDVIDFVYTKYNKATDTSDANVEVEIGHFNENGFNTNYWTFNFNKDFDISFGNTENKLLENPQIKATYYKDNKYSRIILAFLSEFDKKQDIQKCQTFIGKNDKPESSSTIESVINSEYGVVQYDINGTSEFTPDPNDPTFYNSFDRFDLYVNIAEIDITEIDSIHESNNIEKLNYYHTHTIEEYNQHYKNADGTTPDAPKWFICKQYNLVSDASYIPLFAGTLGEIKTWAEQYYKEYQYYSIELLGYSFKHLLDHIETLSSGIYEDDEGHLTNVDAITLLETEGRVYEDYKENNYFHIFYNPVRKLNDRTFINNNVAYYSWEIDISEYSPRDKYDICIYNYSKQLNIPIAKCKLNVIADKIGTTNSNIHYISALNANDQYYFDNGYCLFYGEKVVGTPAVFADDYENSEKLETNSYYNISLITADIINNKLLLKFYVTDPAKKSILDANSFITMIYLNNVAEYERYHYLYHHSGWPYARNLLEHKHWNDNVASAEQFSVVKFLLDNNRQQIVTNLYNDLRSRIPDTTTILNIIPAVDAYIAEGNQIPQRDYDYLSCVEDLSMALPLSTQFKDIVSSLATEKQFYNSKDYTTDRSTKKTYYTVVSTTPINIGPLDLNLSNYNSLEDVPLINDGSLSFKISEESTADQRFPNNILTQKLFEMFNHSDISYSQLTNIFEISNTYIFETYPAKNIADIIGEVELTINSVAEEYQLVYSDFLSQMYEISKYDYEILSNYIFISEEEKPYVNPNDPNDCSQIYDITRYQNAQNKFDDLSNIITDLLNYNYSDVNRKGLSVLINSVSDDTFISEVVKFTITEENIKDFTKIYVNYIYDPTDDGITLFFNYNNFFCSPYRYKRKNTSLYFTELKPSTYLSLKSGETGVLDIILQVQYHNDMGLICAVKDIPILSYRIWNVSDDKPKFIILQKWMITKDSVDVIQGIPIENKYAILDIGERVYNAKDHGILLKDNYTTANDFVVTVPVNIVSDAHVESLTCDFVYEFTDKSLEVNYDSCLRGLYSSVNNGLVHCVTTDTTLQLGFTVKAGAAINEKTLEKTIFIDAINCKCLDDTQTDVKVSVSIGKIVIDFSSLAAEIGSNRFLAQEYGSNLDNFIGFVLSEPENKFIRIYQDKLLTDRSIATEVSKNSNLSQLISLANKISEIKKENEVKTEVEIKKETKKTKKSTRKPRSKRSK